MKLIIQFILCTLSVLFQVSCKKEKRTGDPPPTLPVHPLFIQDITIPNLPSPYYHFTYNEKGQVVTASFASGLLQYAILYSGDQIVEMKSIHPVNKDRLQFNYNSEGAVSSIHYTDETGAVYKKMIFSYQDRQLIQAERLLKSGNIFIPEKTLRFSYHADGNLRQLTQETHPVNGQPAFTIADLFEEYDSSNNADAFTLLHPDFFEHLVLLRGVVLQKNNPRKVTRSGEGTHYQVLYSYMLNEQLYPVAKNGAGVFTSGPDAGKRFSTTANYSYY